MRRPASLTAAVLIAAIALAACGGSSKPASSTPAQSKLAADSGIAMSKCMRTHGVPNFPDPSQSQGGGIQIQSSNNGSGQNVTVNGVSVNAPAFQAAMQKCQSKLPQGPPISAAQVASLRKSALKMAECMRSHGVPNFPDPKVTAGPGGRGVGIQIGAGSPGGAGITPNSPAFQQAQRTCGPLMGAHFGISRAKPQVPLGAPKSTSSSAGA